VIVLSFDIAGLRIILPPTEYLTLTVGGVGYHGSDFPQQWPGAVCPAIVWRVEGLAEGRDGPPGRRSSRSRPSPRARPAVRLDGRWRGSVCPLAQSVEASGMPRLRDRTRSHLLAAVMVLLAAITFGAVALLATGRLRVIDAIALAAAPWALLAAAFRPDWLLLMLIAMPVSLTAGVQTNRVLPLVAVALAALLVTGQRLSLGLRTGLVALIILNVAGICFRRTLEGRPGTESGNDDESHYTSSWRCSRSIWRSGMSLTVDVLATALIVGVMSTLVVGFAGYGALGSRAVRES